MNFEEFKIRREEILRERASIIDCSQMNLYASLTHLVPSAPADLAARIHRCHLAARWAELFDLPAAWAKRALVSVGVRDSLARLFGFYAQQRRGVWLPADCYPVFQELARSNGLEFQEYVTLPRPMWPWQEANAGPDLLLATNPLKPVGRWLSDAEVTGMKHWLAANPNRRLLLDAVYTFGIRFHESTRELIDTGQTILLHSLTKGWLRPRVFGVALVPDADLAELRPIFQSASPPQTNLAEAHELMTSCSDLPKKVAAEIEESDRTLRSRVEWRISGEIPKSVGYFYPVTEPWSRLLAQGILGIPATVFGSKSDEITLLSSLGLTPKPLDWTHRSFFFDIAAPWLADLTSLGAAVRTERGCKCDIVVIRKGQKTIEVVYEPHGPPFCDLKFADGSRKRIDFAFAHPAATRMGRGDKTEPALSALESEIGAYLDTLRPLIEAELR